MGALPVMEELGYGPFSAGDPSLTASELLLALHSLDPAKDGVRLKQVMTVLDHCLARRDIFGKTVLASVLQQLNQRSELPPLCMRFLMQAQAAVPGLKAFIIEQLAALVNRQIWTNKSLFLGWNLAVRQNAPDSFPAYLQVLKHTSSLNLGSSSSMAIWVIGLNIGLSEQDSLDFHQQDFMT